MRPTIASIRRRSGVAGQVSYTVTTRYEYGPEVKTVFMGSVYGTPGPVQCFNANLSGFDGPVFVDEPARFGDTFDEMWVRRYYAEDNANV